MCVSNTMWTTRHHRQIWSWNCGGALCARGCFGSRVWLKRGKEGARSGLHIWLCWPHFLSGFLAGVSVRDVLQYRCITAVECVVTLLHAEEMNSSLHPESRHSFKQTHRRQIGQRRKTENKAVVCYAWNIDDKVLRTRVCQGRGPFYLCEL